MPNIEAIQTALSEQKLDGCSSTTSCIAIQSRTGVLGIDHAMAKRRWFYIIPAEGTPRKLVHRIEADGARFVARREDVLRLGRGTGI